MPFIVQTLSITIRGKRNGGKIVIQSQTDRERERERERERKRKRERERES